MPREGYTQVKVPSGQAWILSPRISDLQKVDMVFFDCDGVLIDVRESYDATTIETVKFLARKLMSIDIPNSLALRRVVLELKRSGGFNNDWDVSYVLLLALYVYLPKEGVAGDAPPTDGEGVVSKALWQRVGERIMYLAGRADSTGLASVERTLIEEGYGEPLDTVKRLLGYPVEDSIVARLFDEIFYGPQLFRQKFKVEPKFYVGRGFIEKETPTVSREVLTRLINHIGKERIGIISGRDRDSAKKTLGELLNSFESRNLLFLMVDPDYGAAGEKSSGPLPSKPDPEILLKAVESLGPFQCCLYVGDSAEDLMMVQRANKILPRFAFAGVYGLVNFKDEACSYFLEGRADMVLPSVNDLPGLLDFLGGWNK